MSVNIRISWTESSDKSYLDLSRVRHFTLHDFLSSHVTTLYTVCLFHLKRQLLIAHLTTLVVAQVL